MSEYRPVTMVTFALNYAWGQVRPAGYHWVNNLLHALNAMLVWLLALKLSRRTGNPQAVAGMASLSFAVHPVHIEAVAGIVGRAELLMTAGYLLALLSAMASREALTPKSRWGWAAAAFGSATLSAFSKEQGVTIPAAVLLLAVIPAVTNEPNRIEKSGPLFFEFAMRRLIPSFAMTTLAALAYLAARRSVLGSFMRPEGSNVLFQANPLVLLGYPEQRLAGVGLLPRMAELLVLPWRQSPDYSPNAIDLEALVRSPLWVLGLGLLGLAVCGLVFWRRWPLRRFAAGLLIISLALGSNLFITLGTILGERLLYLPSVAICLLAASIIVDAGGSGRPRVHWLIAGACWVCLLAVSHFRYLPAWRDNDSLWTHAYRQVPGSGKAMAGYAMVLRNADDRQRALQLFDQALVIVPNDPKWRGWRAVVLAEERRDAEALPELEAVHRAEPGLSMVNEALATIYTERGELDRAETVLREGVRALPESDYGRELLRGWLNAFGRLKPDDPDLVSPVNGKP